MSVHPSTHDYRITGMSCSHCTASVAEEVGVVAGVHSVDVDLGSGRLTVTGRGFDEGAVRAAVAEAGYGVAS